MKQTDSVATATCLKLHRKKEEVPETGFNIRTNGQRFMFLFTLKQKAGFAALFLTERERECERRSYGGRVSRGVREPNLMVVMISS